MEPYWREQYPERTEVILIDEESSVRELLAIQLVNERVFTVCGEVDSVTEGFDLLEKFNPQMLITEIEFVRDTDPNFISTVRARWPEIAILVYTGTSSSILVQNALDQNPHGIAHKRQPLNSLRHAYLAVRQHFTFFDPHITKLKNSGGIILINDEPLGKLDRRQLRILQMVVDGLTSRQIAEELRLSAKTIEHYRSQLMRKLGVRDRASLVALAISKGLASIRS